MARQTSWALAIKTIVGSIGLIALLAYEASRPPEPTPEPIQYTVIVIETDNHTEPHAETSRIILN